MRRWLAIGFAIVSLGLVPVVEAQEAGVWRVKGDAPPAKGSRAKNCSYWSDVGSVAIDGPCSFVATQVNGKFGYVFTLKGGKKVTVEYVESQSGWHRLSINGAPAMGYEINRGHLVATTLDLKQSFEVDGI